MSQSCLGEHKAAPSLFATRTPFAPSTRCAGRPKLSPSVRYALLRQPNLILKKPVAYASLAQLAAAIHRDRGEAGIELENAALLLWGEDEARAGVSVWTQGPDGARDRYLGWVYLAGGDRQVLQAALFAAMPQAWAA